MTDVIDAEEVAIHAVSKSGGAAPCTCPPWCELVLPPAAACSLSNVNLAEVSTPNGDCEDPAFLHWSGFSSGSGAQRGRYEEWQPGDHNYHQIYLGGFTTIYSGVTGHTFLAGVTYVLKLIGGGTAGHTFYFGLEDVDETILQLTNTPGTPAWEWIWGGSKQEPGHLRCISWTPIANRTGVRFKWVRSGTGSSSVSDMQIYTAIGAEEAVTSNLMLPPVAGGEIGVEVDCMVHPDHQHPPQDAAEIAITDPGTVFVGEEVEAALTEVYEAIHAVKSVRHQMGYGDWFITPENRCWFRAPFPMTLLGWSLTGDVVGSITIDVRKDSYANFPPTVGDSIVGEFKPTLASQQKNEAQNEWNIALNDGDVVNYVVQSASGLKRVDLDIYYRRTA